MNNDNSTRKLQLIELDILKKVLKVLEENGLRYYMLGGTLLGAVRHKGFIPWDDDIDIGIPRKDYEQFLKIIKDKLPEQYELQIAKNKNGRYYYARIVNNKYKLLRSIGYDEAIISCWIDVFPLDGLPNNKAKMKIWKFSGNLVYKLFIMSEYSYFANKNKKCNKVIKFMRKLFCTCKIEKIIPTKMFSKLLDKILQSNDFDNSEYVCNFCGFWGDKEIFPRKIYDDSKLYEFEDIKLCGPSNYDLILTQMYGNYMVPPKDVDKDHHNVKIITDRDNIK